MTGGEYVTKSSLTPSRLRSGSKPSGISFLWFSYTKYISNRTLTLSQGLKLKFHFLIASHVTKSLNRRLTAITKQRGSAPLTPAGACAPWTPLSLRQSGARPQTPKTAHSWNIPKSHHRSFKIHPYYILNYSLFRSLERINLSAKMFMHELYWFGRLCSNCKDNYIVRTRDKVTTLSNTFAIHSAAENTWFNFTP